MIFLIIFLIIALAGILMVVFTDFYKNIHFLGLCFTVTGIVCSAVIGCILIVTFVTNDSWYQSNLTKREVIVKELESDFYTCNDTNNFNYTTITHDVMNWNSEVVKNKAARENIFIKDFYHSTCEDLELIDINNY